MIEPKLRFKADDGSQFPDWEEKVFGDFVDTHLEKTSDKDKYPLYSLTIESGVQPKTDRYEREFLVKKEGDNYKIVPPNAFVYNPMNLRFGALKVNHEKFSVSVSGYYDVFSLKDNSVLAFWENYLVTPKMLNYYFSIATGSLIEKLRVHYSQFVKIKKPLPSLPEQQKIAEFLSTIDTVIEKQKGTVVAWEERRKGVMQKLFSQEVRFKADDGSDFPEWEEKKLGEVFKISTETNGDRYSKQEVLSVSDEYGVVNQIELQGRSFAGNDISKYKVVKTGQLIYTRSPLATKPFGIIKIVDEKIGIVSPLYIVNDVRENNCSMFWYYNFDTPERTNNYLKPLVRMGAKHTMNISNEEWLSGRVLSPCLAEQQKIADCISSMDEVIGKQKATLAAWEELKKGLLQQMFV